MNKLLAPNGKPSNLTPEQYRLVRTPAFKKWFGDWEKAYETGNYDNVSKVIDEQTKEPLRVYRGDINNYNVFDKNYSQYGRFYFTDKYDVAKTYTVDVFLSDIFNKNVYTGRVKEYFLNIRNLYVDKFPKKQEMINSGSILKNSYDPLIEIDEYLDYHSNIYVVFEPNQIKLADGTNTTFDSNNPDIRFMSGGEIKNMVVLHNISPYQIKRSDTLGGLISPSIAILKIGEKFTDFGDITLIGNKDLINPETTSAKVYSGDVYSPSVPRKYYYVYKGELIKKQNELTTKAHQYDNIANSDNEVYSLISSSFGSSSDFDSDLNKYDLDDLINMYNDKFKIVYLVDKGIKIKIPQREKKHYLWGNVEFTLTDEQKSRFKPILTQYNNESNEKGSLGISREIKSKVFDLFVEVFEPIIQESVSKYDDENENIKKYLEKTYRESFEKNVGTRYDWGGWAEYNLSKAVYGEKVLDEEKLKENIQRVFTPKIRKEYDTWLINFISQFQGGAYFESGKSKLSYTLENLIDETTKSVVGQEKTLTYGVNKAKSFSFKKFNTIKEIKDNSWKLVSKEQMTEVDKINNQSFHKLASRLKFAYSSEWEKLNSLAKAIADFFKGKSASYSLSKNNFIDVKSYDIDLFKEFANKLRNSPVDYFEAKLGRAVKLSEFKFAIIPDKTNKEIIDILKKNGIKIKKYSDYEERTQIVNDIVNKNKLAFNKGGEVEYEKGGKVRLSKTPAPKKERIYGSKVNKPKSSESKKKASSILLSPKVISSINTILEKHNSKSKKKIPLATAKAVVRRGMGAYSSTHRPTISGGKPNSRVAWGLARLNAFVYKIQKGYSKSGRYTQDDDLINELGYKVKKYELGGLLIGEYDDENTFPTREEAFEIIENSVNNEGNEFIGEDGMFENEQKAKQYVDEVYDFLYDYYSLEMIPVYRSLSVPLNEVDLDPYLIGESWSLSLDSAKIFGSRAGLGSILSGYVPKNNVDWESAFRLYVKFSDLTDSDSEFELPIPPNNKIYDVTISDYKNAKELEPYNNRYDIGGIFQGTPHEFDRYSTEYMGTGEGQQVFGWGLYFTDQKTIAERYAYIPSENTFYIDGVSLKDSIQFTQEQKNIILNIWRDLWQMGYAKTSEDYLFEIINEIEQKSILLDINDESVFDKETILEINQDAKIYYDIYEKLKKSQIEIKSNIVGITLFKRDNESDYDLLLWDSAVNVEQLEKIFIEAEKIGGIPLKEGWYFSETKYGITPELLAAGYNNVNLYNERSSLVRGHSLYTHLSNELGSDKEASLFLLRAGIHGIKYKSGTLSGFADKEGYNYVIFNADDVTIEQKEKYESGGNIEFEYKLNEVYPNIFLLEMYDQYDLASCFVRCQAFYEWDNFRGKDFKIQDFHNSYAKTYPQLKPYQEEFYGFNLPSDVIRNCYKVNKERNNYDKFFLEVISKIKKDNYYLIGVVEGDTTTLNHELAHAFFWADKSYRDDMTKLVNKIPNKNELLKILKEERGYGENVLIDEAQAFLSTGLIVNISDWQKYKKPFEHRFERQKNHNSFESGGEITLTYEQVENKLGRKLHWWNDDIVSINGIEYKKVFLKNEYKKV